MWMILVVFSPDGGFGVFAVWMTSGVFHRQRAARAGLWKSQDVLLRLWDKSETRSNTSRSLCMSFCTFSIAYITVV